MMISVVIPLYNKSQWIIETIQSALNQQFRDFEIIVVDDGSTDDGPLKVKSINDCRVRLVCRPNAGVSAARNRGIEEARGEYIAFLDADDEWRPEYLATQYFLTRKYPECNVFACNYEFRNAEGVVKPTVIRKLPFEGEDGILSNYFEVASYSHPPLWTSAVMVRKTAIQAVGGFPVGIKSGEDLLTWAKLAVQNSIAFTQKSMAVFLFDERIFDDEQRRRVPESIDFVGDELAKLYYHNARVIGLRQYVGVWHKMRARIFLSKHHRRKGILECVYSIRYTLSLKIVIFLLLAFMPYCIINYAFKKLG